MQVLWYYKISLILILDKVLRSIEQDLLEGGPQGILHYPTQALNKIIEES